MPRDDGLLYDLLRKDTQFAALGLDVLCGKDSTYQRHAVHAGALELQNVLLVDAANGYHRHIHGVADVQQGLPGHLAHVRLGVGGKYRAYAKVVRAVRHSVQRFLHRVGGNADHHTVAHALAHLCGSHIVLPHMDALGVALQGHLHVIVDEQRHTVLLAQGVDLLTEESVRPYLHSRILGHPLYVYSELGSTNNTCKTLVRDHARHGTVVAANCQTAGKGRRGRTWESPADQNIYMSLLLRPEIAPVKAPMLTLVMAYAAAMALRECTGLDVQIKWPNDLVINGKKICGILTEMSTEAEWIRYVIVGIGINVNMDGFPGELGKTATSLKLELGRGVKRSPLVAAVMNAFEKYYALFEKAGDLSGLVDTYNLWSANTGRQVRVLDPAGEYQGEALGIDSQGALLVKCSEGEVKSVISGEVSVRGVYGYV